MVDVHTWFDCAAVPPRNVSVSVRSGVVQAVDDGTVANGPYTVNTIVSLEPPEPNAPVTVALSLICVVLAGPPCDGVVSRDGVLATTGPACREARMPPVYRSEPARATAKAARL